MRYVNSGLNVQFTAKHYTDTKGWVIVVTDENDVELRLDTISLWEEKLTAEQFQEQCARWLNNTEDLYNLRKEARAAEQRMRGFYSGVTPFGTAAETKLVSLARTFDRNDVYLGTAREMGRDWFVFGPWLRALTGERFYRKSTMEYALEFIETAYRKAGMRHVQPSDFRQMRPGELPVGADWVARGAAQRRGIEADRVRVVDVQSIGNGGHVVTWTDGKSGFYVTEDYNNIDIFRS